MEEIKTITADVDIQKQTSAQSGPIVSTSFWVEEFVFQRKLRNVTFFIIGGYSVMFIFITFGMGLSKMALSFIVFIILRFIDLQLFSNKRDILSLSNRTLFVHYCLTIIRLPVYFLIGFLLPSIRVIGLDTGVLIILPFLVTIFLVDVSIVFIKNKIIKLFCIIVIIFIFFLAYWVVSAPGRFFSFISPNTLKKNITSTSSSTAVPDISLLSYSSWKRVPVLRQDPSVDYIDDSQKNHDFFFLGVELGDEIVVFDSNSIIIGDGITQYNKTSILGGTPAYAYAKVSLKRPLLENESLVVMFYDVSYKYTSERQDNGWYRNAKNERVKYTVSVINKENEKQKKEQNMKQALLDSLKIKKTDFTSGNNNAQLRIFIPFSLDHLFSRGKEFLEVLDILEKYNGNNNMVLQFRPYLAKGFYAGISDSFKQADLKYLKYLKCAQDQDKSLVFLREITLLFETENISRPIQKTYEEIKKTVFTSMNLKKLNLNEKQFNECLLNTILQSSDYVEPSEVEADSPIKDQYIIINNETLIKGSEITPDNRTHKFTEDDIKNAVSSLSR